MRAISGAAVPAISAILIVCSAAGILLETAYRTNSTVEAAFCRFRICDTGAVIGRARAARLEPGPEAAARGWQESAEALRRDPAFAYRWCDAGESLSILGETEKAASAFRRAVELAPAAPPVLLRAAGFQWRAGRPPEAVALSSRILQLVRDYDSVVFLSYTRSGLSTADLLRSAIPPGPAAAQSFFEYSLARHDTARAAALWPWIVERGYTGQRLAARYVDFLLAGRLYPEAAAAWTSFAGKPAGDNLVFNGGFEREFSGARLDWTFSPAAHAAETRDPQNARSGHSSLRVQFDGAANLDYRGVWQFAVVTPGAYRLQAWAKASGITSDRGVALRVFDPDSPSRLDARTAALTGSGDWVPLQAEFEVRPETGLVQLQLCREPSWKFDNKLAGTIWIDDVELIRTR